MIHARNCSVDSYVGEMNKEMGSTERLRRQRWKVGDGLGRIHHLQKMASGALLK